MSLPLKRFKVLDLSRLAAGNMVSHMLADYGADVIKVERPGEGDDTRKWGPPYIKDVRLEREDMPNCRTSSFC